MTDTALATATVVWRARAVGQDTDDPGNAPQELVAQALGISV